MKLTEKQIKILSSYISKKVEAEVRKYRKVVAETALVMRQGSHGSVSEDNEALFEPLQELLESDQNPYYELFETEELSLDSTDGYVGIIDKTIEGVDIEVARGINKFIREHLEDDGDKYQVMIGGTAFRK